VSRQGLFTSTVTGQGQGVITPTIGTSFTGVNVSSVIGQGAASATPTTPISIQIPSTVTVTATGNTQSVSLIPQILPMTGVYTRVWVNGVTKTVSYKFHGSPNRIKTRIWGDGDGLQYSVIKKGTSYTESSYPTSADYSTADIVYRGGFVYDITAAEAALLQAAGYTVETVAT
jgi:hypothetical protein